MEDLFYEKKSGFTFDSCQSRRMMPHYLPTSRMGAGMTAVAHRPHLGPGYYENEQKTNFQYQLDNKSSSTRGYTLGARTSDRFSGPRSAGANNNAVGCHLGPGSYEHLDSFQQLRQQSSRQAAGFLSGSDRFPSRRRDVLEATPCPGNYSHEVRQGRQVHFQQSFGSQPVNLPNLSQQSTLLRNTDKLISAKDEKKYHRKLAYLKLYY